MTYDFNKVVDRRGTQAIKWQWYDKDVLPMWVADMDFLAPEPVIQALQDRVAHGIFGYERYPPELREVIVTRLKQLYGWEVAEDALVFLSGVVPGFYLAASAFVQPDEGVMVQSPVYPPILQTAQTLGLVSNVMELTWSADGSYAVDFDRFARTVTPQTRMFLLCNPHNPVGRVFREDELAQMAEVCLRHDVLICSDEIHCDIVFSGQRHIPIAALSPEVAAHTITLMAPSKTFNIAGLHCAFAVIPDPEVRKQFNAARRHLVGAVNVLGYTAALAAYQEGQPWLGALLCYLEENRDLVYDFVTTYMPGVRMWKPEGTYLAWLDCREAAIPEPYVPYEFFLKEGRVALNDGVTFGPGGEGFVRLNFGCPRSLLLEGLERMREALVH